ncbi:hypothetical protein LGK97_13900 [Clostridium sp. CS001]|uniref:hypothetical protein n=1 Tax=Clostridium sp. CS001 TaxID=2880648 RepID=UPI001CF29802|nr:hypothetical protein [Clostridium sp. CS001]MCB2290835.1 hypothetical protein [Clostridium sp. CS001]
MDKSKIIQVVCNGTKIIAGAICWAILGRVADEIADVVVEKGKQVAQKTFA